MKAKVLALWVVLLSLLVAPVFSYAMITMTWGWVDGTIPPFRPIDSRGQISMENTWFGHIHSPGYYTIIGEDANMLHFYDASSGAELPGSPISAPEPGGPMFVGCLDVDGDGLDEVFICHNTKIAMVEWLGPTSVPGQDQAGPEATSPTLGDNYPNPFNPQTTIRYSVQKDATVSLSIFDVRGYQVRTLQNGQQAAGSYSVQWDGKDRNGAKVASGNYFYQLTVDGESQTKKMIVIK